MHHFSPRCWCRAPGIRHLPELRHSGAVSALGRRAPVPRMARKTNTWHVERSTSIPRASMRPERVAQHLCIDLTVWLKWGPISTRRRCWCEAAGGVRHVTRLPRSLGVLLRSSCCRYDRPTAPVIRCGHRRATGPQLCIMPVASSRSSEGIAGVASATRSTAGMDNVVV